MADIRRSLADYEPARQQTPQQIRDRASVAVVLAGPPDALSVCLIRRATREDDRWSGQMAFPGGRASPEDSNARAVAERESDEEVELKLNDTHFLAPLSELDLRRTGSKGVLSPFVYYVGQSLPALRPDPREVAAGFWLPLRWLWSEAAKTTIEWQYENRQLRFPGLAVPDEPDVVWGLSLRILANLATLAGSPLP